MKKLIILTVIFGLAFLVPLMADENEEKDPVDVKIKVGAKVSGEDGYMGKVKEYDPVDDGVSPVVKAKISGKTGSTFFNLFSDFRGHMKSQYHNLKVDFNRVLKQELSYDALYHRLDHDPLTNIDVVSHARSAAYVENLNPNDQYNITRYEFKSRTELAIPSIPFLKVYMDFRNESRKGHYQARTLSKCSACHVVAQSRSIDNYNRDIRIGGVVKVGKANFDYSFTNNTFKEKAAAPMNDYLYVQHPEKKIPVFNARITTGNNENLEFDAIPESKKDTHLLKAAVPVSKSTTITAHYVNSSVENVTSALQWESSSFAGGFSTRLGKKGFFNVIVRQLKVTNDSIFIDLYEPLDVAGAKAGMTYAEAYGVGTFDWTRNSTMNRTVWDVAANFRYRLSKQFRIRLGYEYNQTERPFQDAEETKTSTFKAKLTIRPAKEVKLTLDGKFKTISDPFANKWGGIAPAQQTVAYTNPFVGTQFFQWHADRRATLTNQPESVGEMKARLHWSPSGKFALNGNFLFKKEKNDNLAYAGIEWNREMTQWGIDMWFMLTEKMPVTATYYNYKNKYESVFAIAALEGCGAGIVGGMTGTLTDMMGYDTDNQTFLVNFNYAASEKLRLYCNFNYNISKAEIVDLTLDSSQLPYLPGSAATALNFDAYEGITEYSKLDMKQLIGQLGFTMDLSKSWALNGSFYYYFYDDLAEYLFTDTEGKSYSFTAGFTWTNN